MQHNTIQIYNKNSLFVERVRPSHWLVILRMENGNFLENRQYYELCLKY
jgi:hypothetical protein